MTDTPKCTICGEPMPAGEEMFKFHGYSGSCPKPPLPKPQQKEIWLVFDADGEPIHCASWQSACHEHINDAINEYDIKGAAKWTVRQATLVPNVELRGCAAFAQSRLSVGLGGVFLQRRGEK